MTAPNEHAAAFLSDELFHELVRAAGQAPSPDNNQPWAFRLAASAIEVYHCRERALPSDARDLFSWIALGAAIENLALRASARSMKAEVSYHDRPFSTVDGKEHIATVRFAEGGAPDPLQSFIEARVTNRRLYSRQPLTDDEIAALGSAVRNPHDQLLWIIDRSDRARIAGLVAACDRIRFEHRPFHEEFHKVLRYGEDEARRSGDGLELRTLELPPGAGLLMRWLRPWKRMRRANRFGMSRMFASYAVKQIARSGAVGLLTTDDCSDSGYLEGGRSFQRLWLAATQLGLAVQPMGSLPLFLMKFHVQEAVAALPEHSRQLGEVAAEFEESFPGLRGRAPLMVFRVGWARAPSSRSSRYSMDRTMIEESTFRAADPPRCDAGGERQ